MEEEYTLNDFENVLCLKNQLISVSRKELMDVYQNYDNYLCFLDTIAVMSDIDSAFLLLNPCFIDTIEDVIQIHRFNTNDSQVRDAINSIIGYLNRLKSYNESYKNHLKEHYLDYHEQVRLAEFVSEEDFLSSLSYDAVVYVALKYGNMDIISNDTLFLSSLNYFIEAIPEVFQDPVFLDNTINYLSKIEKCGRPFFNKVHRYCVSTKRNFQKIKRKEE